MSRIFLSHSSRDNAWAIELRDWLATNGWDDVFLDLDPASGLAPGERWQNALKAAADRCEAVVFLISPNWLASNWCLSEFLLAKQLGKRLFPLLIGGASISVLPNEIASDHQAVDLAGDPLGWERLKQGLRRAGLDANSFPFAAGRRPYPGFEPLTEEDAAIFFGREAQVLRGLDRLRLMRDAGAERVMVVLGASGAGKSSFLRAGLWPRLRRDDRNFWPLPVIRPERAVLTGKTGLHAALEAALNDGRLARRPELAALPRARARLGEVISREAGLAEILMALRQAASQPIEQGAGSLPTPVLVIDQAEELLNEEGRSESERFRDILGQTLGLEKSLIAVLAIRSDAFPRLQADSRLAGVAREPFDLSPMPEGSLRLVIEGPAKLATPQLQLEPALVDVLLADSTGQDALPLLAFTLGRLVREHGAEGHLSLKAYVAGGGVRGAITAAVEEALAHARRCGVLPADPKAFESLMKQAFIPHLARVNDAGEFARRIAYTDEIPAAARPLIDLLVEARLLTRDRDEHGEVIEVSHEALLREWPLLRGFLETDREFLVGKRQLAEDLKIWRGASPKGKQEALLSGLRLNRAQHWLSERSAQDISDDERAFIGESVKAAEAARRQRNGYVMAVIALLAAFSALAAYQWRNATQEAALALANAQRAEAEKARANANEESAQHNANQARQAQGQAEENAKKAELNEAHASVARARAQIQESISLADRSLRESARGDILKAMRTALAALPADSAKPDRPFVSKAEYALAKAFLAKRLEAAITPSTDWVNDAGFSSDGSRIVIGTRDGFVKIYDSSTFKELKSITERRMAVMSLAYSGDGKRLATAHQDPASLIVRDPSSGATVRDFRINQRPQTVILSKDGSRMVALNQGNDLRPIVFDLDADGRIRIFDSPLQTLRGSNSNGARSVSISPNDRLLLLVTYEGVYVWDLQSGTLVESTIGKSKASAGSASIAKLDFSKQEQDEEEISGAAFANDDDLVLVGKRNVYVVDPRTAEIRKSWRYAEEWQVAMQRVPLLVPNGTNVTFQLDDVTLGTFALADGKLLVKRTVPSKITAAAISPNGKIVAAASEDLSVRAWTLDSETALGVFPGHRQRIRAITFSPDATQMMSYGDNTAYVWDLREDTARLAVLSLAWTANVVDSRVTAAGVFQQTESSEQRAGIWRVSRLGVETTETLAASRGHDDPEWTFSRSGRWLAFRRDFLASGNNPDPQGTSDLLSKMISESGRADPLVEVRPNEDIHALVVIDVETGNAAHVVVVRDGQLPKGIAFVSDDGVLVGLVAEDYGDSSEVEAKTSVEIWDAKAGKKLLEFSQEGHDAKLSYSETGRYLTLSTELKRKWGDYVVSMWDCMSGALIRRFDSAQTINDDAARALFRRDRALLGSAKIKPMLIDISTGNEVGNVAGPSIGSIRLNMSPDRHRLLVTPIDAPQTLWSLDSEKMFGSVPGPEFDQLNTQYSGDGHRIVARGKREGKDIVGVFDSETGRRLDAFPPFEEILEAYGGQTGARVAIETNQRAIELREVASDAPPIRINLESPLHRWRFSSGDERLVTVDEAGTLQVWDTRSGDCRFQLVGLDTIEPLGAAPLTGTRIPFHFSAGGAAVLDTMKGEIVWRSTEGVKVNGLTLASDEKSMVVSSPGRIEVIAFDPIETIESIPIASSDQFYFAYNEEGDLLEIYVRGDANIVHLIDVRERKDFARYENVGMVTLASKADHLALGTQTKLTFRNARTGVLEREIQFEHPIRTLEFNLFGDAMAVVSDDNKVFVLDVAGGAPTLVATLRQPPTWVRFAADRTKLLLFESSGQASLWDTASGKILTSFASGWAETSRFNEWILRVDPSGAFVAVRSPDNYVRVYQTADGKNISEFNWDDNVFADMAFSSDAKKLLVVTENGWFCNWDIAARKCPPGVQAPRSYSRFNDSTLERTPDPSQILAIDPQGRVDLYSLNFNSIRTFYSGEPDDRVHAALSPDGSLLATIGNNGVLRLWHVGSREILAEIPGLKESPPGQPRFSPDGRVLAVASGDRSYSLFRAPLTGDGLERAAKDLLAELPAPQAETPSAPRTYRLGVALSEVSTEGAERHKLTGRQGAEVVEVIADSPAQVAGVRVGDVIVKVNGKPVTNVTEAVAAIKDAHLDLPLELIRDGVVVTARAALDD